MDMKVPIDDLVGRKVHTGYYQKGGAGVVGIVKKVEGGKIFIENSEGRMFKALPRTVTLVNGDCHD